MPNIPQYQDGFLTGWRCSKCNIYNDLLRAECSYHCGEFRDSIYSLIAAWTEIKRTGVLHNLRKTSEEIKELHMAFFNQTLAKSVEFNTIQELDVWIDELEEIALTAKAAVQGAHQGKRDRMAKLSKEDREKLVSNPDITGTDAFSAVKKRAERMSQADKLVKVYRELGFSEEQIQEQVNKFTVSSDKPRLETLGQKPVRTEEEEEPKLRQKKENVFQFNKKPEEQQAALNEAAKEIIESRETTEAEVKPIEAKTAEIENPSEDETPSFLKGLFGK